MKAQSDTEPDKVDFYDKDYGAPRILNNPYPLNLEEIFQESDFNRPVVEFNQIKSEK